MEYLPRLDIGIVGLDFPYMETRSVTNSRDPAYLKAGRGTDLGPSHTRTTKSSSKIDISPELSL